MFDNGGRWDREGNFKTRQSAKGASAGAALDLGRRVRENEPSDLDIVEDRKWKDVAQLR